MPLLEAQASHGTEARPPSHLFYLSSLRRPLVDRAEGIYFWTRDGRRFIDGSSGPIVANIGHSNRNVLDAMKRQMDKATFAYPLHFENEPAEQLARELARKLPKGMDRIFFVSRRFGSDRILHQVCAAVGRRDGPAGALESDYPLPVLSRLHARLAFRHWRRCAR
ncbi:hypothetical protein ACVWXM_009924 [Bradyrhizobium sp. GM7.3]